MQLCGRIHLLLNYTYYGLCFQAAEPASRTCLCGCLVLSLSPCVRAGDWAVRAGSRPLMWLGIALICSGNGRQMSEYKRKLDPAKKRCHPDLLFNARTLALLVFGEKQMPTNTLQTVGQAASSLRRPSKPKRGGYLAVPCKGWHLLQASELSFYLEGRGRGTGRKRKWGRKEPVTCTSAGSSPGWSLLLLPNRVSPLGVWHRFLVRWRVGVRFCLPLPWTCSGSTGLRFLSSHRCIIPTWFIALLHVFTR